MFCSSKLSSTNLFTLQCMEKKEAVGNKSEVLQIQRKN